MKQTLLLLAALTSLSAFSQDKPASQVIPAPVPAPSDCSQLASVGDTQQTTFFECKRQHQGSTVYCLVVKSGVPKGTPSVTVSCTKL